MQCPTRSVAFTCTHTWCRDCVKEAFTSSYTSTWTRERFPPKSCCSQQPLGEELDAMQLMDAHFLLDCFRRHWEWAHQPPVDQKTATELFEALEDSQKCQACGNVVQRQDGCNHMV